MMKNKKKRLDKNLIFFLTIALTAVAAYTVHIVSGYSSSEGQAFILYSTKYPLILLGEYAAVTVLLLPFIKNEKSEQLNLYIIPLMLFAALGMMRVDAAEPSIMTADTHNPALMFLILFAALTLMIFSGHTLTGLAGTLSGTLLFPAFGMAFAPFIAAAAFLFEDKNKKEKKVSLILHGVFTLAALIWGIIKSDLAPTDFSKKYIPVILLVVMLAALILIKREYRLIPLAALPLFPLLSGILFGAFPTPLFTLSASVSPLVILSGAAAITEKNKKIKSCAEFIVHNPAIFAVTAVFILHTANVIFVIPGNFRNIYM